ncbi:MAG: helix-turn-helix domain-containing protein [Bacteroidaceae bacterium]|nr:helix-turn-helix domain-containing protein [Bacteroidaceae bacterium]
MKERTGDFLMQLLKRRNISEARLAEALKVSRPMVACILKGERALSLKQASHIERFLDLPEGTLLKMQIGNQLQEYKAELKQSLLNSLSSAHAFWSHPMGLPDEVPDEEIIEKTFMCLDVEDIATMFELYPKSQIKKVWLEHMVPQGDYLRRLNTMIAYVYFDIDNPERYLQRQENIQLNKRLNPCMAD